MALQAGPRVYEDENVFSQIKEKSRPAYIKAWKEFKEFLGDDLDLEMAPPTEQRIIDFFNHLRTNKQMATSSIWTNYSYINSIFKRKYGTQLQSMPRITMVIKGFGEDMKQKAGIFEEEVSSIFFFYC